MKPRRWIGAGAIIALALMLVTVRSLDAPLFLYPSSASLPAGLYMRSFETVRVGSIVAFHVPDAARRYMESEGTKVPAGHLFIKPVAAGPGDRVCNSHEHGLEINSAWMAPVAKFDSRGEALPLWRACRKLDNQEFLMFSDTIPNSFDSRYYGTIQQGEILGTYVNSH